MRKQKIYRALCPCFVGFLNIIKPSQPRRTADDLHFLCQEDGLIIATTSDKMEDELDKYVVEK